MTKTEDDPLLVVADSTTAVSLREFIHDERFLGLERPPVAMEEALMSFRLEEALTRFRLFARGPDLINGADYGGPIPFYLPTRPSKSWFEYHLKAEQEMERDRLRRLHPPKPFRDEEAWGLRVWLLGDLLLPRPAWQESPEPQWLPRGFAFKRHIGFYDFLRR